MTFPIRGKEECSPEEWEEYVKRWTILGEEGYFLKRHEEYLENRIFEPPQTDALRIPRSRLREGIPAADLFYECGLTKSKSDARRLIEQGGAYVNSKRVEGGEVINAKYSMGDEIICRAGKKHIKRVIVT